MNYSDWQKLGLGKPSSTDYEEHSAVGDLSTGRRFKAIQSVPDKLIIDELVSGTTYIGNTKPGTATSAALWRIRRITKASSVLTIEFAEGADTFTNIWDSRTSLNYS